MIARTRRPAQPASETISEPVTMDTLPSNVLPLWPGLQPSATPTPNLQTSATKKKGKKAIPDRGLHMPVSAFQVIDQADLSPSPANPSTLSVEEFRRMIEGMKPGELRERFRLEATSHRSIVERSNKGEAILDPEFADFGRFLWHLGPRPAPKWTVDRIDTTNPTYGPGLCRWASPRRQANNRGITIYLTARGETRPLADWARLTNQNPKTLAKRYERGYSDHEVIFGRGNLETGTIEPPARPPQRADEWPPGTAHPAGWEAAYLGFCKVFPDFNVSRAAFMLWVLTNAVRRARERLVKAFPTFEESPYSTSVAHEDDPDWLLIERVEPRIRAVQSATNVEDCDLALHLVRRWRHVDDLKKVAALKRRAEYDE